LFQTSHGIGHYITFFKIWRKGNAKTWYEATHEAVLSLCLEKGDSAFCRQVLIQNRLEENENRTEAMGKTTRGKISKTLQELRKAGVVDLLDNRGTDRLNNNTLDPLQTCT